MTYLFHQSADFIWSRVVMSVLVFCFFGCELELAKQHEAPGNEAMTAQDVPCIDGTELDVCGECGGDGSSCSLKDAYHLSLGDFDLSQGQFNIYAEHRLALSGFEISFSGIRVISVEGGRLSQAGWSNNYTSTKVISFSPESVPLPAGKGVLLSIGFEKLDAANVLHIEEVILTGNILSTTSVEILEGTLSAETYSLDSVCGNGLKEGAEECDTAGESASCNEDCTSALCGDTKLNTVAGEECDDGNVVTESCAQGVASCEVCTALCQLVDVEVVDEDEEYDDGNTIDGDGCSASCLEENCADGEDCGDCVVPQGACDCQGNHYDACNVCGGDGSTCADCSGVANGQAYYDNCNFCDASPQSDCVQDCAGIWGGVAQVDDCGICGGDDSTCEISTSYTLSLVDFNPMAMSFDVFLSNPQPASGFEIKFNAIAIAQVVAQRTDTAGWLVSHSANEVNAFSFTGAMLPAGQGSLFRVYFENPNNLTSVDIVDVVVTGEIIDESTVDIFSGEVSPQTYPLSFGCDESNACNYNPEAMFFDSEVCTYVAEDACDCSGAVLDACGICGGGGALAWYADQDGDGLGEAQTSIEACVQPQGYLSNALDIDDACACEDNDQSCFNLCGACAPGGEGNGFLSLEAVTAISENGEYMAQLWLQAPGAVDGFEFEIAMAQEEAPALSLIDVGGGAAEVMNFTMSWDDNTVMAFYYPDQIPIDVSQNIHVVDIVFSLATEAENEVLSEPKNAVRGSEMQSLVQAMQESSQGEDTPVADDAETDQDVFELCLSPGAAVLSLDSGSCQLEPSLGACVVLP